MCMPGHLYVHEQALSAKYIYMCAIYFAFTNPEADIIPLGLQGGG